MKYFVYVIKSLKTGIFYKGQTNNLERRLWEHNADKYGPHELVFVQVCDSRSGAMKLEKFFKTGKGREIIQEFSSLIV